MKTSALLSISYQRNLPRKILALFQNQGPLDGSKPIIYRGQAMIFHNRRTRGPLRMPIIATASKERKKGQIAPVSRYLDTYCEANQFKPKARSWNYWRKSPFP